MRSGADHSNAARNPALDASLNAAILQARSLPIRHTGGLPMLWALGAVALLISLPVAAVLWMTSVPGRSHAGPLPPLTPDQRQLAVRLQDHVRAIASKPHNVGYPQELEQAARYIESTPTGVGYEIHRQPFQAGG